MKVEERFSAPEFGEIVPGVRVRRGRRRRRRGRVVSTLLIAGLLGGAAYTGVRLLESKKTKPAVLGFGLGKGQSSFLFMIRRAGDLTKRSDMLVLMALDSAGKKPFILFIPTDAQTEVPGHGLDSAGRAFAFGDMPLQVLAVDNMLGIRLKRDVAFTDLVIERLVDQVGGLDIDVEKTLLREDISGNQTAVFDAGHQHMDGPRARAYLQYQGADETELSRLARAQQVWEGLFVAWQKVGKVGLTSRLRLLGRGYGTGLETGTQTEDLANFWLAMSRAGADARVYATVPVTPVGAGGDEQALRIDEPRVAEMVQQYLAGSIPLNAPKPARIEILNGNGTPQVGEVISLKLIPEGFRLVIDRNARSFNFQITKIVIYSRDDESYAAAKRIKQLLGVGEIQVGLRDQTVVDITIVVGKDFRGKG